MTSKYREAKNAYYKANAIAINRARILKELLSGKRSPSLKTLARYDLIDEGSDGSKTVVVPNKPRFKIVNDIQTKPDVINVISQNIITPTKQYDPTNAKVIGKDISNWVVTVVSTMKKGDGKVRADKTIVDYAKVPYNLSKIRGEKYDENANIKGQFMNADETIERIKANSTWKSTGSQSKFIKSMLFIMKNYPPFKDIIHPDVIKIYEAADQHLEGIAKAAQLQKKNNTPIFVWSYVRRCVREHFGVNSYEYLMVLMFNEIIARDDLGLTMAYTPGDMDSDKKNYLYLDRPHTRATVFLNTYKTEGAYGKHAIVLKKYTYDVIVALHPDDTKTTLFPFTKLSKWIGETFKKIPQLKDENIGVRYIRHSIISSALLDIAANDPEYAQKVQALAAKSYHTIKAQQQSYLSPLKDGNGKRLAVDTKAFTKAYDDVTMMITGDEPDSDDDEEITSKPARLQAIHEDIPVAPKPKALPQPSQKLVAKAKAATSGVNVGMSIKKKFRISGKLKVFDGQVVSYKAPYYKIRYSDGDEEEMTATQVRKHAAK